MNEIDFNDLEGIKVTSPGGTTINVESFLSSRIVSYAIDLDIGILTYLNSEG